MSELTMSLIIAGVAFVVVVYIYSKWQEYRARKSVDRAFSGGHDDVLMSARDDADLIRQEPQFDQDDLSGIGDMDEDATADTSNADQVYNSKPDFDATMYGKELSVDDLIDCVIPLEFEAPIRGEKLLKEISDLKYVGRKPVHFIGLTHDGKRDEIAHGGVYTALFAGVQMVSRSGPLNELEYSEFVSKLREIADRFNAHSDVPDMNRVMSNARELHQFVAEHDAQLSVNVLSNGAPWDITTLLGALEKQGFDVRPDGRLVMPDGDVGNLFTLSTNVSASETVTSKLTLLLDVPCVSPDLEGFGVMAKCARSLASRLGGTVVDDGNNPISDQALAEIADQVRDFCNAMAVAEIPAGSRRAKRLFS
ncbi:cell division protein ZipA C-terminal FtsZ-binding domain-containing protein [Undibacterium flavidum]|uniref:Cell division protein ZipA n=1 Tax=Undibacterium flavidum TaxID=2762297 RepID=A0ABR6YCM1_9BURK|nr:cell division protein ZipA C-terminal FtsZ-binding domain-containing protein [Undibacterium flavidum]MBC3874312.1 cell division protein [Undibacterium flavidum]